MTSEVVVMNRLAVALAADSAATVTVGSNSKVYNSADKLFMLSKQHPVGVMVYNNASLLGIPWETILKVFRRGLGSTELSCVEDYAKALLSHLDKNASLFPEADQSHGYLEQMRLLYQQLRDKAMKQLDHAAIEAFINGDMEAAKRDVTETAKAVVSEEVQRWQEKDDVACYDSALGQRMADRHSGELNRLIIEIFGNLSADPEVARTLRVLAALVVSKNENQPEFLSGIVFAGFGANEYLPAMRSYELGGVYEGKLKYRLVDDERIGANTPAVIRPFAQSEMLETFLKGMGETFRRRLVEVHVPFAYDLSQSVVDAISDLTPQQRSHWKAEVARVATSAAKEFIRKLDRHCVDQYYEPALQAVANLPKSELAHVAASLVNLNSFQKRVSMSPETVGGPVDVAVISKGDGFVWIERKHYFQPELNHHFFANYNARLNHGDRRDESS